MPLLTREQILAANDVPTELVPVPEWGEGGEVCVRGLTGLQRDRFEASMIAIPTGVKGRMRMNLNNIRARLVAWTVINEVGARVFTDADIAALGEKSAVALSRVYDVAQRLSGLSDADMEELEKNSGSQSSDGFVTD